MKKASNRKAKQAKSLGPCQVLMELCYCGQPAFASVVDVKEVTIPSAKVINYKSLGAYRFCPDHMREGIFINANGTVTFGKSAYELEKDELEDDIYDDAYMKAMELKKELP